MALAFSLLLCGIGAEMVLRYRCSVCSWTEGNFGEYVSPYEEPSNGTWYFVRPANDLLSYDLPEFDFELRTNSLGIRDIEHPAEKPVDEFRIIGLGDSFTEGQGASYKNSYLQVLERNLNASPKRVKVRIISGGVSGSDPFFCYKLLKDKLIRFDPDLVTLTINSSDVWDVVARGGHERFLADGTVAFAEPPANEWLFAKSHLYRVISFALFGHDWFGLTPSQQITEIGASLEKLEMLVDDYQDLARKQGFRFLVILHPHADELSTETYLFDASRLERHFAENGINYFDLMPYFAKRVGIERERREELYWKRDFHHNEAGYRLFAEGLEEHLLRTGLLESKTSAKTSE